MPDQQPVALARTALQQTAERLYQTRLATQQAKDTEVQAAALQQLKEMERLHEGARTNLEAAIETFYRDLNYQSAAGEWRAGIPVLLLPVRLETRFASLPDGTRELWVRIFPDDIHVHTHEPLLTESEQQAGQNYWLSLLLANGAATEADGTALKQKAWQELSRGPGVQRALWVVRQTQPANWQPSLSGDPAQLQFPQLTLKTHVWTQAPRTQLLPDRFEVRIYRNGIPEPVVQAGARIPDVVFLGPDPLAAKDAFAKNGQQIELDESFAWITNFDKAVAQGLGVRIKLAGNLEGVTRIDRLVVMGLLASASPEEGKTFVEGFVGNHYYAAKGFSFLAQGSATNNTETGPSGYQKNEAFLAKGYYDGSALNNLEAVPQAGANRLAAALGVNASVFGDVPNATLKEAAEATAMNTALYAATIGYYMEVLASPMLKGHEQAQLRQFFTRYVTAAGPLPAVRVGDQPYGVLLTSDLRTWAESKRDPFYEGLVRVLKVLQDKWNAIASSQVPHVHKAGDPSEMLLEVLGLQAGSVTFDQRLGHMPDVALSARNVPNAASTLARKQSAVQAFLRSLGFEPKGQEGQPLVSFVNFYEFLNNIAATKLVDGQEPSEERKLGVWNANTGMNYIQHLAQLQTFSPLQRHVWSFGNHQTRLRPPRMILYMMLRHAMLQELNGAAEKYYLNQNMPVVRGSFEKSLINFSREFKDLTSTEVLEGRPSVIDSNVFKVQQSLGDYFLGLPESHQDSRYLTEMRQAMSAIAGLSTAKLQQYLSDHIDLCSYRLDAWEMGLFNRRLQTHRGKNPEGIHIGAYGWVEDLVADDRTVVEVPEPLRPEDQQPVYREKGNAGFVQTPSLNHATAAGLLMAGYQNHATPDKPGDFAINLSSQRVRRALFVYEGIQNNQTLEALLGYQFERALHDITTADPTQNLNQYILSIREQYPIENPSIPQQGSEAQETVPAYSVVNGLAITQASDAELGALVPNAVHRDLVIREKNRLADVLDALNDMLVAETAFQAVQGKTDRTVGLLNAMRHAELPPDLELHKTPRSSHLSFTNRVTLHFDPGAPQQAGHGWTATPSPRSQMEPGLNQWLGEMIGDPAQVIATVTPVDGEGNAGAAHVITLGQLNRQPVELIFQLGNDMQAGAKELERMVAAAYVQDHPLAEGSTLRIAFEPESLAAGQRSMAMVLPLMRQLRQLVAAGRPANAADFSPRLRTLRAAGAPPVADAEELAGRVGKAVDQLEEVLDSFNSQVITADEITAKDFFSVYFSMGAPVDQMEAAQVPEAAVALLHAFLNQSGLYGVKVAYPETSGNTAASHRQQLLQSSAALWKAMGDKAALCRSKLEKVNQEVELTQRINRLQEAARAVLGDDFTAIPLFRYGNAEEVARILADEGGQLLAYCAGEHQTTAPMVMETWLQSVGRVRENMDRLEQVRMIAEAQTGAECNFQAAQFPFREKDSWLAVEFPHTDPDTGERFDILNDTIAFAIHGSHAAQVNAWQSALLVDEWTEAVPNDKEITGLAFNYDQPNASAPNALLLAVEPTGAERWNWEVLAGVLTDTLNRAKTRAVEPAHLMKDPALDTLLPMTIARFDLKEANSSLDYLVASDPFFEFISQNRYELYEHFKA